MFSIQKSIHMKIKILKHYTNVLQQHNSVHSKLPFTLKVLTLQIKIALKDKQMTFDIQFEEIHKNGEKDPQIKSPDLLMIKK